MKEIAFPTYPELLAEVALRRGLGNSVDVAGVDPKARRIGYIDQSDAEGIGSYLYCALRNMSTKELDLFQAEMAGPVATELPKNLWGDGRPTAEDIEEEFDELSKGQVAAAEGWKNLPTEEQMGARARLIDAGLKEAGWSGSAMHSPAGSPFTYRWSLQDPSDHHGCIFFQTDHLGVTAKFTGMTESLDLRGEQKPIDESLDGSNAWVTFYGGSQIVFQESITWDVPTPSWAKEILSYLLPFYERIQICDCDWHQYRRSGKQK